MAKLTATQIKEQTKKILAAIAKHKRESKGKDEYFTSLTPEEIVGKLKRAKSPFFISSGCVGASPGGTFRYNVTVHNPDPSTAANLYLHLWVGSGNVDPTVGTFLANVDARFPRLTQPTTYGGLTLRSGISRTVFFSGKVPSGVERAVYLGNCCLMWLNHIGVGQYLDRGSFLLRAL